MLTVLFKQHAILVRVHSYNLAQDPIHSFLPGLFSLRWLTAAALVLAELGLFGSVASVDTNSRAFARRSLMAVGRPHTALATASCDSGGQSSPILEGTLSIRRSCNRKRRQQRCRCKKLRKQRDLHFQG